MFSGPDGMMNMGAMMSGMGLGALLIALLIFALGIGLGYLIGRRG